MAASSGQIPIVSLAAAVPERSRGAEGLAVGGDFVILDGQGQMLRGLNGTGAAVWELIDGRRPLGEIASEVARRYQAPEARVLEDVVGFARALAARGLIRFAEVGS
ncbi:MAG TPA: PqqD family protein [Myxococcaceae bacterium]|nr:PqqD family protein [Myxococcaceae bacterium]